MQSLHTNTHSRKMNLLGAVDEWNTKAICKQIIPCSPCMIHGYIAEHFSTLGYRVVFVVPSNHLLQEKSKKRLNATTVYSIKLFAIPAEGGQGRETRRI